MPAGDVLNASVVRIGRVPARPVLAVKVALFSVVGLITQGLISPEMALTKVVVQVRDRRSGRVLQEYAYGRDHVGAEEHVNQLRERLATDSLEASLRKIGAWQGFS